MVLEKLSGLKGFGILELCIYGFKFGGLGFPNPSFFAGTMRCLSFQVVAES